MASADPFQAAETSIRRLLEEEGLPQPDAVEHRGESIVLLWHEQKLAVVVDAFP